MFASFKGIYYVECLILDFFKLNYDGARWLGSIGSVFIFLPTLVVPGFYFGSEYEFCVSPTTSICINLRVENK